VSEKPADNNGAPRNPAEAQLAPPPRRGRPRVWDNEREKERGHRLRRAERAALVVELLIAVRNAEVDDPELHRAAMHGDDTALLGALVGYYQARNWNLLRWQEQQRQPQAEEGEGPASRAPPRK